jgi:nanoRNase/pAp phosphatase (c-di-AMP/oligoRNAs hydrolase)
MPLAKMVIDHHVGNNITGTDFVIVDSSYSSTSQMIYELASDKVSPSKDYLEAIYIGMYADTGGFKYNVSPRVHEACAEIMSRVDVSEKLKKYTQSTTPDDIVILSIATTNLKSFVVQGIRFYITTISQDDIVGKLQNPNLWSSNIATRVLSDLNDVDVLCVASEKESGVWRIRFRSFIEGSHARILAESFSGGGHNKAAGGVIFTNDHRAVLAEIKKHAEKLFS